MIPHIEISVDDREARDFAGNFITNFPKFANNQVYHAANLMQKNLSKAASRFRVTGYLARNFKVIRIETGNYAITAPGYLTFLESGTLPRKGRRKGVPFNPYRSKFIKAAASYGMTPERLSYIIYKYGTKPHPFTGMVIYDTVREIRKRLLNRTNRFIQSKGRNIA